MVARIDVSVGQLRRHKDDRFSRFLVTYVKDHTVVVRHEDLQYEVSFSLSFIANNTHLDYTAYWKAWLRA